MTRCWIAAGVGAALLWAPLASSAPPSAPPTIDGLGAHTRTIKTTSAEAQRLFDQGLLLLFAFNHDEAIRCFEAAAQSDPKCAMAYWGVAVANGPHINFPMVPPERAKAAWEAIGQAKKFAAGCSEADRALIEAAAARYAEKPVEDRAPLDRAYAAAMKKVWEKFPADADAGALYAESLMDLRPWDLWKGDGSPQKETPDVVAALEAVLKRAPDHPLALHLYIHAMEASKTPGKAASAADRLRNLCPGLGHLVHMPSHIDVRTGNWQAAVAANDLAVAADRRYVERAKEQGFYRIYIAHNRHMLAFAALMQGESKRAEDSVRAMLAEIPEQWLNQGMNAAIADGFHAMPIEVLVRFGKWERVLSEPEPAERFPIARALRHAARGVAFAALKRPADARKAQESLRALVKTIPAEAQMGNNKALQILAVADSHLEGEVLLREGKTDAGLAALRKAASLEDGLKYDEPPDWIIPVRHALGAALLNNGRAVEAEKEYREDLARWPHNGWSLFGLAEALKLQGKSAEAEKAKKAFETTWSRADVVLKASCYCQAGGG